MNPLRSVVGRARDVYVLAREPGTLWLVVLYWMMTAAGSKRTQAEREQARVLFASRILSLNPETALSAAESRRRD